MSTQRVIGRRRFIHKTGAALTAAIAIPNFLPASVLGRGGARALSERITMGFIGNGHQGAGHLLGGAWTYLTGGYAARTDVQVLATCDVIREHRESAAQKVNDHYREVYGQNFTACKPYNDFRHVLERGDIDAVLIASPPHWHATMAVMAAQAGKDIYCEKPTALSIAESRQILAAVARYGRVYQAGTQQRSEYGGKFRMACEFIRSGRIGKLQSIYAYRDGGGIQWPPRFGPGKPVPDGLDWDLFLGPMPWFPYDGRIDGGRFDFGGTNWGQHHYDIVQWAAEADATGPVELFTENGHSCYRYASGVVVYGKPYPGEPVGADGGICCVGAAGRVAVDRDALVSDPPDIVHEPLRPNEVHLYHSNSHSGNFLECIRTRQRPICSADVAHRAVSALLLGGIVKQLQRPLKWDPVAQQFPEDEEANRLLSFAHRPPWNV